MRSSKAFGGGIAGQAKAKKIIKKVNSRWLDLAYAKRTKGVYKFSFGHLLVIGGSYLYSGSPIFNAVSALRAGVDLATIAAPEKAATAAKAYAPELIAYPIKGDIFTLDSMEELLPLMKNKNAVVIGGGLTRSKEVADFVLKFIEEVKLPVVIDADAIYAVSGHPEVVEGKKAVITPNLYELRAMCAANKLTPPSLASGISEKVSTLEELSEIFGATILFKGDLSITVLHSKASISAPSLFMTKGGFGDVLAGVCGAYLSRGLDPFVSASVAAYVTNEAGKLAAKEYGESMLPTDLIDKIPSVINRRIKK